MIQRDIVLQLLELNNGYLTSKAAKENKIDGKTLQRMLSNELIERVAHGLYIRADIIPDRFYIMQYRCSTGIYSHLTALYLHLLSDRDPIKLAMTVPTGMNIKSFSDENVTFYYNNPKIMKLGITEIESMSGMMIKVYDTERTICDCLNYINNLDRDLVLTGLKRYLRSNTRNNMKLLEYATEFKMRDIVRRYMEVL
jgi:predicted transcriptional regulator of viral defense system